MKHYEIKIIHSNNNSYFYIRPFKYENSKRNYSHKNIHKIYKDLILIKYMSKDIWNADYFFGTVHSFVIKMIYKDLLNVLKMLKSTDTTIIKMGMHILMNNKI